MDHSFLMGSLLFSRILLSYKGVNRVKNRWLAAGYQKLLAAYDPYQALRSEPIPLCAIIKRIHACNRSFLF